MEQFSKFPTADGHTIYGVLNTGDKKTDKLIIFIHGLSGSSREHQYFNASPYFTSRGFDTFRFDLYSRSDNGRQLSECSISTHAEDLNTVIDQFKNRYEELYLIGHSLGVPTVLKANHKIAKKIIFWDPTRGMIDLKHKKITYNEALGLYIMHWGLEILVNQQMIDEFKEVADMQKNAKLLDDRMSFVFAGKAEALEVWLPIIGNCKYKVVEEATHIFLEEGTERKLHDATYEMLISD